MLARLCPHLATVQRGIHRTRLQMTGDLTLPCLLLWLPGPGSATGEDTFEALVPGNPDLLSRLTHLAMAAGARAAEPGEFTARAWYHGRLSLDQAEGVAALIGAASDRQLRAAAGLASGKLGRAVADIVNRLVDTLALVEAGIDFTDQEDVVAIDCNRLRAEVSACSTAIGEIESRSAGAEAWSALPRVVIAGPANAGKSTLFNALLGRERAVVSGTAGTTRDVLAEPLRVTTADGGVEILLCDTAGADPSEAGLNPEMQRAAARAISEADVIVLLLSADASAEMPGVLSGLMSDPRVLRVQSRIDIEAQRTDVDLHVSGATGANLDRLRLLIAERLGTAGAGPDEGRLALLPRHESALRRAQESLCLILNDVEPGDASPREPEIVAAQLRSALDGLGEIGGAVLPDEVLGRIFATFCVGK